MSERERATVSVFDGARIVGRIAESRPSIFEAILPGGISLGLYNSVSAAAHALVCAARGKARAA